MFGNGIIIRIENALRFVHYIALMFFYFYFALYVRTNYVPTFGLPEYVWFIIPSFLGISTLVRLLWYHMGVRYVFLKPIAETEIRD